MNKTEFLTQVGESPGQGGTAGWAEPQAEDHRWGRVPDREDPQVSESPKRVSTSETPVAYDAAATFDAHVMGARACFSAD